MAQARRKSTYPTLQLDIARYGLVVVREGTFWALVLLSAYLLLALLSYHPQDPGWRHAMADPEQIRNLMGYGGAWMADLLFALLGTPTLLLPVLLLRLAWRCCRDTTPLYLSAEIILLRVLGLVSLLIGTCGLCYLLVDMRAGGVPETGGYLGAWMAQGLSQALNQIPARLFLLLLALAGLVLGSGVSPLRLIELPGKAVWWVLHGLPAWLSGASVATLAAARRTADSVHQVRATLEGPRQSRETASSPPSEPVTEMPTQVEMEATSLPVAPSSPSRPMRVEPVLSLHDMPQSDAIEVDFSPVQETSDEAAVDVQAWSCDAPVLETPKPDPEPASAEPTLPRAEEVPPPVVSSVTEASAVVEKKRDETNQVAPPLWAITRPTASASRPSMKPLDPDAALPPLDLLDQAPPRLEGFSDDELNAMAQQVEDSLASFGVRVEVAGIEPGPVITRFELDPAPGVKVSQITNLSKDLARGLSVMSVRVVEVIPGKPLIGLEIPNHQREKVFLREIFESKDYIDASSALTLALGKDIGGRSTVADLTRMPHLLVAGTTGSGKSVSINAMLLSILYKSTPQDVRLIMVDPKLLELSIYDGIPHLLAPVVTDMEKAANALRWCVAEMDRRYTLMKALKVRNIAGFNRQVREAAARGEPIPDPLFQPEEHLMEYDTAPALEPLPFIVVVIDELADMMMIVGKKVEELIARLAQKARAAGIHLILATQRPSVDVITGLIKANVPSRIAFQVSSKIDSRTILDQMGAEALLGHGDMLYLPPGTGLPQRVHGAFVDDHEVNAVVEYLKQTGSPDYIDGVLEGADESGGAAAEGGGEDTELDPLYDDAVRVVTESRKASISYVQRRLKIGYNRAARMIEQMEESGVISTQSGSGSREVLAPPPIED